MPRLAKIAIPQIPIFVSTSIEEGLPIVATSYMEVIVRSALARAQFHYPVIICALLVESNHVHMLLVLNDPDDLRGFMGCFKTEMAHAINRLRGRTKRTVWCSGYDSPSVLTESDVIQKLVYIYTNPAKDKLEDCIELYPNFNTWKAFKAGAQKLLCPRIRRPQINKLPSPALSKAEQDEFKQELLNGSKSMHELSIEPNAWMQTFGINDPQEIIRINQEVEKQVKDLEAQYRKERQESGKSVIGKEALSTQSINKPYEPQRTGKRSLCHCSNNIPLRIFFIMLVKDFIEKGKDVLKRWRQNDFSIPYPIGLYPPALPKRGNLLPAAIFEIW